MNNVSKTLRTIIVALFCSLLFVNCGDWASTGIGDSQSVQYDLRGTWVRTEAAIWPETPQTTTTEYGKVVLDYNTITITGPVAHLKGFTRNTKLEAYTEENKLYIKDKGAWQNPVTYRKWEAGGSYPRDKMLTLEGGGVADDTFKRTD